MRDEQSQKQNRDRRCEERKRRSNPGNVARRAAPGSLRFARDDGLVGPRYTDARRSQDWTQCQQQKRTHEHARRGSAPDAAVSCRDGEFRKWKRFASRSSSRSASPNSTPGSRRSGLSSRSILQARGRRRIAPRSAGGRESRFRRSTACRSGSRTSSRRSTCPRRTVRRCSRAFRGTATPPASRLCATRAH